MLPYMTSPTWSARPNSRLGSPRLLTCLVQRPYPRPRISGRGQRRYAGTFFRGARRLERLVALAIGKIAKTASPM